jgi:ABC-type antimicrobial peptide transport system permease subunit
MSAVKLGLVGCVIGVLGSLAASRLVSSFLFDVSATDPFIYAAAAGLMMLVALLASALPASRAAAADPNTVLRAI